MVPGSMQPRPAHSRSVIAAFPGARGQARPPQAPPPPRPPAAAGREPTLAEITWTLVQGRWLIAGVTAAALALSVAYLLVATPLYASNVIVQVEARPRTLVGLEDVSALFAESTPADTEMQLIRSRSLLAPIVEKLHLDVSARPRTFPLVGRAIARRHAGPGLAEPLFGLDGYAWGGEKIRVTRLKVPDDLVEEPLVLTALGGGRFSLAGPKGEPLLQGEVGKPAPADGAEAPVEIFVQELVGRPGTRYVVRASILSDVVERVLSDLKVSEVGKKTGVISIGFTGPDPATVRALLDDVATSYQRQNIDVKSGEAAKTLEFLESQLPVLKERLDAAEGELSAFRLRKGTVDLTQETQAILERSVDLEKQLSDLEMQRSELRTRFTESHPSMVAIADKSAKLRAQLHVLQGRMRDVPETEVDSARLVRDAKVASELYALLANKAQNLRILKSGTVGNVRIIDSAVLPFRPVSPKRTLVLGLGLVLGLVIGGGAVLVRKAFDEGADDLDDVETATGLPVMAAIPHSRKQRSLSSKARRPAQGELPLLTVVDPGAPAVESLRVMRTALHIAMAEAGSHVVTIGSPSPGVGKTFVSANLAAVFAASGSLVALLDADLRRGSVHRYFGMARQPGLAEAIAGDVSVSEAVFESGIPGLHVVPAGRTPDNPAELLARDRFQSLLEEYARAYDLVIVDTPPILAVADAALVGRHAGVNVLVLRAGRHPVGEIALAMKRMQQGGAPVTGLVMNEMRYIRGRYGHKGRYQRYEYRSRKGE